MPNDLGIGGRVESQKGPEDDGLEMPDFLKRPLLAQISKS